MGELAGPDSREPLVLLVEDNADNIRIYRMILEHGGIAVIVAEDGETGVRLAKERKPDLILMDVSVPLLDGWEATRLLKAEPETASIQIVALTAHALDRDRERAIEAGCDGYLAKPALPRVVLEEVKRRLGLPQG